MPLARCIALMMACPVSASVVWLPFAGATCWEAVLSAEYGFTIAIRRHHRTNVGLHDLPAVVGRWIVGLEGRSRVKPDHVEDNFGPRALYISDK